MQGIAIFGGQVLSKILQTAPSEGFIFPAEAAAAARGAILQRVGGHLPVKAPTVKSSPSMQQALMRLNLAGIHLLTTFLDPTWQAGPSCSLNSPHLLPVPIGGSRSFVPICVLSHERVHLQFSYLQGLAMSANHSRLLPKKAMHCPAEQICQSRRHTGACLFWHRICIILLAHT